MNHCVADTSNGSHVRFIMKTCFKCGVEKPLSEFYKHAEMADGHVNKCKVCNKKDVKDNYRANIDHYKEYEISRANLDHRVAARKSYAQTEQGKQKHSEAVERWAAAHPDRNGAKIIVNNAVRDGRLTPWPVCSVPSCCAKPEAHHPDYSKPLDVVWLCRKHHYGAHRAFDESYNKRNPVEFRSDVTTTAN